MRHLALIGILISGTIGIVALRSHAQAAPAPANPVVAQPPVGEQVRIVLRQAPEGQNIFEGRLNQVDATSGWLMMETAENTERHPGKVWIPLDNIAFIHAIPVEK